jgi:beta-glucanase (GH16 family)
MNMGAQDCNFLVWSDEFDVAGAPNGSKWNFETGGGGWGNNELQVYTNSRTNSYVQNGVLVIDAVKSNNTWTSARMVTAGKASWKYGRFEIKAKLPSGLGTWPAIWMMPAQSVYGGWPKSGEIDIMEHVGYDMNRIHGSIHTEAYNHPMGTQKSGNVVIPNVNTQFHVYAIEWSPEKIQWFVDNQLYFTFYNENKTYKEWPFDQEFFLILNIAIGGNWGGAQGIDPNLTLARMEVDYVRVYSNKLAKPVVTGPQILSNGQEAQFSVNAVTNVSYQWTFPPGVEVLSSQSTNTMRVKWGTEAGNVTCKLVSLCEEISSDPFRVDLLLKPTGPYYEIPFVGNQGEVLWNAPATSGNTLTLSAEGTAMKVNYNIGTPTSNPYVTYVLPHIVDLTKYNRVALSVKVPSATGPNLLRIDLRDKNGNINTADLFKITDPTVNGQFAVYEYIFTHSLTDNWLLEEVAEARIYINYGLLGKKGTGTVVFEGLKAYSTVTSVGKTEQQVLDLSPNPNNGTFKIGNWGKGEYFNVKVYSLQGQLRYNAEQITSEQFITLPSSVDTGIYLVEVSSSSTKVFSKLMVKR